MCTGGGYGGMVEGGGNTWGPKRGRSSYGYGSMGDGGAMSGPVGIGNKMGYMPQVFNPFSYGQVPQMTRPEQGQNLQMQQLMQAMMGNGFSTKPQMIPQQAQGQIQPGWSRGY